MRKRITAFYMKLAQSAAGDEWFMCAYEIFVSVWPFAIGVALVLTFQHRLWLVFFFDLATAALLAGACLFLHRVRRKTIDTQQRLIRTLTADHDEFGRFLSWMAAAADSEGKVSLKVATHYVTANGPQAVKPEPNPNKMN